MKTAFDGFPRCVRDGALAAFKYFDGTTEVRLCTDCWDALSSVERGASQSHYRQGEKKYQMTSRKEYEAEKGARG